MRSRWDSSLPGPCCLFFAHFVLIDRYVRRLSHEKEQGVDSLFEFESDVESDDDDAGEERQSIPMVAVNLAGDDASSVGETSEAPRDSEGEGAAAASALSLPETQGGDSTRNLIPDDADS